MSMNEFWVERGRDYLANFNKKSVIQKLRYLVQEQVIIGALNKAQRMTEIKTIMDAGCGFGRITKILCEVFPYAEILGIDISEDQLREARRELPRVTFWIRDIVRSNTATLTDLVTCVEVLMHIAPENIFNAVHHLTRGQAELIITVDWWTEDAEELLIGNRTGFCWVHDYEELFSDFGFELVKARKIPWVKQKLRIWRRRHDE
jgi:2-polyprenyl-3-methyl-5-hydroxy-6-metoxy-1,4-benzoquinol methylase